jgi:hypothetical protein
LALSRKAENYFASELELDRSLCSITAEIVHVFLAKKAGLPFSLTEMPAIINESLTWEYIVKLVNESLVKFSKINK